MSITQSGTPTTQINSTAGTTCNPAIPSSLTTSHYMVLVVAINGNKVSSLNTPTGWTRLGTPLNNSTSVTLAVYGKFWASGDTAPSVTWTTTNKNVGCIVPFLGVDTGTQMDVTVPAYGTGTSATPSSPTATAATMGACRLHIEGRSGTGTSTPSNSLKEAVDITTSATSPAALAFDYQLNMASDAAGTRLDTVTSAAWVAATIWLRPATPDTFGLLREAEIQSTAITSTSVTLAAGDVANSPNGTLVVACISNGNGGVVANETSGVSYPSNAFTLAKHLESGSNYEGSIWYKYNAQLAGAATTVTATSGGPTDMTLWVGEFKGAATATDPLGPTGAGQSSTTSVAATTSSALPSGNVLCIDSVSDDNATPTIDSNYWPLWQETNTAHATLFVSMRQLTGGSTETNTFTTSASNSGQGVNVLASFTPPAAGGGSTFPLPYTAPPNPIYRM